MKTNTLQALDLEIGERAICKAGFPKQSTVTVECIKDFPVRTVQNSFGEDVINNPMTYIKIVDMGKFGLLTSHLISANWKKL